MVTDPDSGETFHVIDAHHHLSAGEGVRADVPIDARIAVMDRFGIDQAVLLPASGAFGGAGPDAETVNVQTAAAVATHPERFRCGLAHVELSAGAAACERVVHHAVTELGLGGVVWHHRFQGAYLDNPLTVGVLRLCAELGVPAFIHVISGSELEAVWRLERVLEQCPEAVVCALDGFSTTDQAERITEVCVRHPQLYCDLGGMISVSGPRIHDFLERIGSDRLLFGTNLYMQPRTWHAPAALNELLHLDVSADVKRQILSGNVARLLP